MVSLRACLLAFCVVGPLAAQTPQPPMNGPTGFLAKTLHHGGVDRHYVVYLPRDYRADAKWPLLVFLNGMGECGTDGWKHVDVGLGPAIRTEAERWPFVVLFPQKPDKPSQWIDHDDMVMAMVAATEKECSIDEKKRFLTGLSQGGAGTWAIGAKHREMWAAIAPVCGYGKPAEVAAALKDLPIWAFHGEADPTVPVQQTKAFVDAVVAAGGKPLLTLYPQVGHNSWDKAYRESGLAEWLRFVVRDRVGADLLCDEARRQAIDVTLQLPAEGSASACTVALQWRARGDEPALRLSLRSASGTPRERELRADDPALPDLMRKVLNEPLRALLRSGVFAMASADLPADRVAYAIELRGDAGVFAHRAAPPDGPARTRLEAWGRLIQAALR